MKILDRVIVFSEYLGVSLRGFSLSIGASAGYLHRLQSARSNIGGDYIEKIIQLYPEINPVWLTTGQGQMLKIASMGVEEPNLSYGGTDFFKQALINYLDDPEVRTKVINIMDKQRRMYKRKKQDKDSK